MEIGASHHLMMPGLWSIVLIGGTSFVERSFPETDQFAVEGIEDL